MNEMEQVNYGLMSEHQPISSLVVPMLKCAASASGIANGTHQPGGVMDTVISGAMGALSSLHDWLIVD